MGPDSPQSIISGMQQRLGSVSLKNLGAMDWHCTNCTLENEAAAQACAVCEAPNPAYHSFVITGTDEPVFDPDAGGYRLKVCPPCSCFGTARAYSTNLHLQSRLCSRALRARTSRPLRRRTSITGPAFAHRMCLSQVALERLLTARRSAHSPLVRSQSSARCTHTFEPRFPWPVCQRASPSCAAPSCGGTEAWTCLVCGYTGCSRYATRGNVVVAPCAALQHVAQLHT